MHLVSFAPHTGHVASHIADAAPWQLVNRRPFLFRHDLMDLPLFDLPRLAELSKLAIESGSESHLTAAERHAGKARRVSEMLRKIDDLRTGKHWLKVLAADHLDAEYAHLLHTLLGEIEELAGIDIRSRMTWSGMDIFMNSPNLQVPYHFDHDSNFLMQVTGEKDDNLFDPDDRAVLTEAEIEDYYRGNKIAGRFRDSIMLAAKRHHLSPGLGVHHPPLAPHLIRNGGEISVSVAVYFVLPEQERRARIYQANHFMRKLGLRPQPPGRSRGADFLKVALLGALSMSNPHTYDERLYSGVRRLAAPAEAAKRLRSRFRPH